jgi:hypothetical protein
VRAFDEFEAVDPVVTGDASPRLRAIAKPSRSPNFTLHQPASHSPTSISEPFGISVTTSLLVPGAARRLVSAASVTGLADAAAVRAITVAAAKVVRRNGMANLAKSTCRYDAHSRLDLVISGAI